MYGKTQSPATRAMISMAMGNPVNLCTRNGAVLREYNGDGALGFYLGINKSTVGRYRAKNKL